MRSSRDIITNYRFFFRLNFGLPADHNDTRPRTEKEKHQSEAEIAYYKLHKANRRIVKLLLNRRLPFENRVKSG